MRIVILLGPPGSGKGTVAARLCERLGAVHVSTGSMLREAVAAQSPVGIEAQAFMQRGELVPDDVMARLVGQTLESLAKSVAGDLLLDGFPRTVPQAERLDAVATELGNRVGPVLLLEVSRATVIERLSGRRVCSACGAGYHVRFLPPKRDGVCDQCSGQVVTRSDDAEETVARRLDVYRRQTEALVALYETRSNLVRVDAEPEPERVTEAIERVLRMGASV